MLTLGQGTVIRSVQSPNVPLRELVRSSLTSVDSVRLTSSIRVNLVECRKPLDDIVDTFFVFSLPGV